MKRVKELVKFIRNGEKTKAESLLDNIYEENECHTYSVALEKILLTEMAKELNDSVRGFYIDTDSLKKALFSENPPTRKTVFDSFRDILLDASKEDNERAYEKATDYIKKNFTDTQLSADKVSEYVGISEKNLIKLFREKDSKTVSEYIAWQRIKLSLSYLENGETVCETYGKCGFFTVETYIRAFKKCMGTTPGQWKRNKLFL